MAQEDLIEGVPREEIAEFGVTTNALLEKHYGISLADTSLSDPPVVARYIQAGQRPFEALNEVAEKIGLERTDKQGSYGVASTTPLTSDDEEAVMDAEQELNDGVNQMVPRGTTESAMHLIDGLVSSNDMKEVLQNWNQGCSELYQSLIPYAEKCHQLFEQGYEAHEECPGVFDYEVSCEFGAWFGAQIIDTGTAPTPSEAEAQLQQINNDFWQQLDDCETAPR